MLLHWHEYNLCALHPPLITTYENNQLRCLTFRCLNCGVKFFQRIHAWLFIVIWWIQTWTFGLKFELVYLNHLNRNASRGKKMAVAVSWGSFLQWMKNAAALNTSLCWSKPLIGLVQSWGWRGVLFFGNPTSVWSSQGGCGRLSYCPSKTSFSKNYQAKRWHAERLPTKEK